MDNIEKLLRELENDRKLWLISDSGGQTRPVRLTASFLNAVGLIFERDGFGTTELHLRAKLDRPELYQQAEVALRILDRLRDCPEIRANRALGRLIFKSAATLATGGRK